MKFRKKIMYMVLISLLLSSNSKNNAQEKVSIEIETTQTIDDDYISYNDNTLRICNTNIKSLEELEISDNIKNLYLYSNFLTNIDNLKNTDNIEILDIRNNSVKDINLDKFPSLKNLYIKDNFNLYTYSLYQECYKRNIKLDISKNDLYLVNLVKDILEELDLDELSDLKKETKIYKYVIDNIEYDDDALEDYDLLVYYNKHELREALNRKGVCCNYSALFDCMGELSGLNVYMTSGEEHAWNIVEVNNKYYEVDPTYGYLDMNREESNKSFVEFIYNVTGILLEDGFNGQNSRIFDSKHNEEERLMDKEIYYKKYKWDQYRTKEAKGEN